MIVLQFQIGELADFLKYGISGLSAIAFILSFFLLNRESGRPKPRPEMLRSIRMFMALTLVLGLVSGVATIMGRNEVPDLPKKQKKDPQMESNVEKKSFIKKIINTPKKYQIEVFYDTEVESLANQATDELQEYKEYDVKTTVLSAKRKRDLGANRTQIRHELTEKEIATKLQGRLNKIMPQDVTLSLKQISSSSPNYVSVFLVK
jgi:hypothetical protein